MHAAQLIKMANQIGAFFATQPDPVQARKDFALHLKNQWDPQMRRALYAHVDANNGAELSVIALEALTGHRQHVEPAAKGS